MAVSEVTEAVQENSLAVQVLIKDPDPQILSPEALAFLQALHRRFNHKREELLGNRQQRQRELDRGILPDFLAETAAVRQSDWQVAPCPADLEDRRVEITGPVEAKMMINALNSGAKVFMADFEDALSPTWENVIAGQKNLSLAIDGTLKFQSPEGKDYCLKAQVATLVLRPRGWHLLEKHVLVDSKPMSASLFDFGLYFFHNAAKLLAKGSGPYFYLPKLESHLEARLWNDVFNFSQDYLSIPRGSIRATVLIETIMAAFEMDEILFELREHASGLNAGRWDYIFSLIKKTANLEGFTLPDRSQVTMAVPFMRSYARLLVHTCHKRGAHAIGGMAAFIPSRKDAKLNELALAKVEEDKLREAADGFDGSWVAHPDLVSAAEAVFTNVLAAKPNQKDKDLSNPGVKAGDLLDITIHGAKITRAGLRNNIDVALRYLASWLSGIGAAGIHNLMEDAATAEISRAQLWQWIKVKAKTTEGDLINPDFYKALKEELMQELAATTMIAEAATILDELVLSGDFVPFLTIPAYGRLP